MKTNEELTNLNTDTEVKYLTGDFPGSPALGSSWGSLGEVLKKALSTGFYESSLLDISIDPSTRIITLTTNLIHSYSLGNVISLSGITSENVDGEYRILDFSSTQVKVKAKTGMVLDLIEKGSSPKISLAPLGYEILYDELSTTGKIVFKNKSTKSPAVLRVVDAVPPNGYLNTWLKFARVVGGQNMSDIDTFVNDEKFPTINAFPDAENTGNKVQGAPGIHGFARWYYAIPKTSSATDQEIPLAGDFPTKWKIIGDSKNFYIFIKTMGNSYSGFTIYSFGNYISNSETDSQNILLHATFNWRPSNENISNYLGKVSYWYGAAANKFTISNWYGAVALYKNTFRGTSPEFLGYHFGLNTGDYNGVGFDYPSESNLISSVSGNTGRKLTSPIFIKDKNYEFRGSLRGITQMYGQNFSNFEGMFLEDNLIVISTRKGEWSSTTANENVPYLFSLKNWEDV